MSAPRYAVFALDPDGLVASWNPDAEQMKGYSAYEIIGQHFSIFYPKERVREKHPQAELEWAARKGFCVDDGWRIRKDGSQFWAHVFITAQRDSHGSLTGFIKVVRNDGPVPTTP